MLKKIKAAVLATAIALPLAAGTVATAQATPLKADGCALSVSRPHPHAGQSEALLVKSTVAATRVHVHIAYRTVHHDWYFTTNAQRQALYAFGVGRPTKNFTVVLTGTVTAAPKGYKTGATCKASFTP